ncbi:hypothetical protein F5887DRAFT_1070861 [Amanita rubescens]|nr:hypothetical protein F5887DRAFT_1070861 [Amanita rubescens]
MNSLFNGFLEAVLHQIPVDLSVENSRLKYLALQKDQETLRLKADFQRNKDDFDTQASKISDLERDIVTARDDIRVKERQLASLKGQIKVIEDRNKFKNDNTVSLQKEIKDIKDSLRAREERIASLTKILEERRRAISKDDWVSKVEKRLKEMSEVEKRLKAE